MFAGTVRWPLIYVGNARTICTRVNCHFLINIPMHMHTHTHTHTHTHAHTYRFCLLVHCSSVLIDHTVPPLQPLHNRPVQSVATLAAMRPTLDSTSTLLQKYPALQRVSHINIIMYPMSLLSDTVLQIPMPTSTIDISHTLQNRNTLMSDVTEQSSSVVFGSSLSTLLTVASQTLEKSVGQISSNPTTTQSPMPGGIGDISF